jgi:polar amino acid transport system substrate-binding protein
VRTAAVLAGLVLAACAPPAPPPGVPVVPLAHPVRTDEQLAAAVPDRVRQDGRLTIGTDPSFPPMEEVLADGRIAGVDIQLALAIARVLGLQADFRLDAFTAIQPGVRAGRFELGIAALSVAPGQRLSTDAVLYYVAGSQLVRPVGSAASLAALCGLAVGTPEGSVQIEDLAGRSRACSDGGAAPITIVAGETQEDVTADLLAGRTAGMLTDSPVAQVAARTHPGRLELAGPAENPLPYAMLTAPSETSGSFALQVLGALNRLIADGTYLAILQEAGIGDGAVDRAVLVRADTAVPDDPFAGSLPLDR